MQLRDYQQRILDDLYAWFHRNPEGNPIVSACVGAGKSVMIAELCRRAIADWPDTRIIMVVASRELCQQNLLKLFSVWPEAPAGVLSASLGGRDTQSRSSSPPSGQSRSGRTRSGIAICCWWMSATT